MGGGHSGWQLGERAEAHSRQGHGEMWWWLFLGGGLESKRKPILGDGAERGCSGLEREWQLRNNLMRSNGLRWLRQPLGDGGGNTRGGTSYDGTNTRVEPLALISCGEEKT